MRAKRKTTGHQPNFDRDGKANWRKHEADVAKRSGGRLTPGSGNKPGKPGDAVDSKYMRECKATKGAGISINGEWLKKVVADAMTRGMTPLVEIRLEGQTAPTPTDWILSPAVDFEELNDRHFDA